MPVTPTAAEPVVAPPPHSVAALDRPLRVLGVDPELGFAGGESQVLGLTLELRRAGHAAELLCDPRGILWRKAGEAGIPCHPLAIRNAIDLPAGLRMRHLLRAGRFDVVHFHTARAHALAPFARGMAGALVVTRRMEYVPNRLFAPYLYNRAVDAVAAISRGVADSLTAAGVDPRHVVVIPSGVDCERFRPPTDTERAVARSSLGLDPGEIAIGTVGALEERKGHRYLIEAIAKLQEQSAPAAVKCLIAGEGSMRKSLAAEIRRLRLDTRLRLLGRVDTPREMLWALDVFAFPSLSEGLGVAMLEAMACGLPVVASEVGGIRDAIEHERSGLFVSPGNPEQLARALMRLAAEPQTRETLAAAARARVVEAFSMGAMASRTLELYRRCLAGGVGR